jgi:hypothetical protein
MSFSFNTNVAKRIYREAERRNVPLTHIATMAIKQYFDMRACGAWMCTGDPLTMAPCGHYNSRTAITCERCECISPDEANRRFRKVADMKLEARGTGIPIAEAD